MPRYPADHKAKTRAKLLEVARNSFRVRGFDGVSIQDLMAEAGLTRGGFYSHFSSKEALVREVLLVDSGLTRRLLGLAEGERQGALEILKDYLDPHKRDALIQCPLVAHALDARRGDRERGDLYAHQVEAFIQALQRITADRQSAVRLATTSIGAATLSTCVSSLEASEELIAAAVSVFENELL